MNQLPSDVKKIITLYLPPLDLINYNSIFPSPDYLENLKTQLFIGPSMVQKIWSSPEQFYNLTEYQNYIRVLTYCDIIVPGSELFVSPYYCYREAIRTDNKRLKDYFDKYSHEVQKPRYTNLYRDLLQGKAKLGTGKYNQNDLRIAIYQNNWDLVEKIVDQSQTDPDYLESLLFQNYVLKGNLKELEANFPEISDYIATNLVAILEPIRWTTSISDEIYLWIANGLSLEQKENIITEGVWPKLFYYLYATSGSSLIYTYMRDYNFKTHVFSRPPLELIIIEEYIMPKDWYKIIVNLTGYGDDYIKNKMANIENFNIVINYFLGSEDEENDLAENLLQKVKGIKIAN